MRAKLLLGILLLGILFVLGTESIQAQSTSPNQVIIYIFWGDGCPYCRAEREFLTELKTYYPQILVREYEVYYVEINRLYLQEMLAVHGIEPGRVPTTFIDDRYWIGFSENIAHQIEEAVRSCSQTSCADPGLGIIPIESQTNADIAVTTNTTNTMDFSENSTITLPIFGEISLDGLSIGLSTALIALVDGFNPCSLWVLSLLLGLVIHSGSRIKTMTVGLTFLVVAAVVYILFIVGLFSVFSFVAFMPWIQSAVALLALIFAVINIKDYFWYKQGVSLTIDDKHKPKVYRDIRGLLYGDQSTIALISATAVMAMGITLIELPCTSGLPVLWTQLIAAHQPSTLMFVLLLGLYMLIFLADELIVFLSVVFTLRASKFEEKQGRLLKLIGGMVMLVLAIVLLIEPSIMDNILSSLLVFGVAMLAVLVVLVLHRRILPHYGIHIGTELLTDKGKKAPAK